MNLDASVGTLEDFWLDMSNVTVDDDKNFRLAPDWPLCSFARYSPFQGRVLGLPLAGDVFALVHAPSARSAQSLGIAYFGGACGGADGHDRYISE